MKGFNLAKILLLSYYLNRVNISLAKIQSLFNKNGKYLKSVYTFRYSQSGELWLKISVLCSYTNIFIVLPCIPITYTLVVAQNSG